MKHPMRTFHGSRTRRMARRLPLIVLAVLMATPFSAHAMRIAYGDIPSIESLNLLIAIERARERGVDIDMTFFDSEDIATQAVVGQEADIGVGAPYALIQRVRTPIRMIYQLSTLRFFPVVNTEHYETWKDLDGETIAVHSRGSGTEALVRLMAERNNIEYANISYVPGSEVRTGAMLQGRINATIVDAAGWRLLQEQGGGKFKQLPISDVNATDEALFASQEYVQNNPEDVRILMEEMLRTWRDIDENPAVVAELRDQYNLLPDLPQQMEGDIVPFYRSSVEGGIFPLDGGTADDVRDDLSFYAIGGQIEGDPEELEIEDFWNFTPVRQARENVESQ